MWAAILEWGTHEWLLIAVLVLVVLQLVILRKLFTEHQTAAAAASPSTLFIRTKSQ